jgi:hypothetical protein
MGMGPRTGRGLGYCSGYDQPGFANFGPGAGRGFGHGRGWRHWARATGLPGWQRFGFSPGSSWWGVAPEPVDEATVLKTQAEQLQAELDAVQKRLGELEER